MEEVNFVTCSYPVKGNLDSMLVVATALCVLVIEKNVSLVAFNSLLGALSVRTNWTFSSILEF